MPSWRHLPKPCTPKPILKQLAESLQVNAPMKDLEKELVQTAYRHVQSQKILAIIIDDAQLLDIGILRKLRLSFERSFVTHLRPGETNDEAF